MAHGMETEEGEKLEGGEQEKESKNRMEEGRGKGM